jgi:pimeloyl-ACP methyl ester carboxylesterase
MFTEKIEINDNNIACFVSNRERKHPLVFIHGAGSTQEVWQAQWLYFKGRAKVIIPDLPGHGDSSGNSYDYVDAYADIVIKLAEKLHINRFVLIGHSMGGAISQRIAISHPELLAGLVLVATGARLRVAPQVFSAIKTDYKRYVEIASSFSMSASADRQTRSLFEEMLAHSPAQAAYNDFTACDRFDVMDTIANIRTKTLIMVGDKDMMTPVKYAQYLNRKIEGSQLKTINDAGHMVMMEKPEDVNTTIEGFVDAIR